MAYNASAQVLHIINDTASKFATTHSFSSGGNNTYFEWHGIHGRNVFGAKTLNMIFKCEFCPDCCRMNKHYQGLKYCDKCNSWINEDFIETHWCLREQEGVQTI